MMHLHDGTFVVSCDECGEELWTDTSDFAEAKSVMNQADWKAFIDGKSWLHRCPACEQGVR